MKHLAILGGIVTVTVVSATALLMPRMASTQSLPSPRTLAALPTYTPAGVGGNAGSAWFIATTSNNEHYPVLCEKSGAVIQCLSGKF